MTTPDHDGPRDLDTIIASMEATLKQLYAQRDAQRAADDDLQANIEAQRRRRAFFLVPGITSGIAAIIGLGRRVATSPAGAAVAASAGTLAATVTVVAVLHGAPDSSTQGEPPGAQPAPPGRSHHPHARPPHGSPTSTQAPDGPTDVAPPLRPQSSSGQPDASAIPTPPNRPGPPTPPPTTPQPSPSPPAGHPKPNKDCVLWLRILHLGVLCSKV